LPITSPRNKIINFSSKSNEIAGIILYGDYCLFPSLKQFASYPVKIFLSVSPYYNQLFEKADSISDSRYSFK